MQSVAAEVWAGFERRLDEARVPGPQRPDYHFVHKFKIRFITEFRGTPTAFQALSPGLRGTSYPGVQRPNIFNSERAGSIPALPQATANELQPFQS